MSEPAWMTLGKIRVIRISIIADRPARVTPQRAQFNVFKQLPAIAPSAYTDLAFIVPRVLELSYTSHSMAPFARDLGYGERRLSGVRTHVILSRTNRAAHGLCVSSYHSPKMPAQVMNITSPASSARAWELYERVFA